MVTANYSPLGKKTALYGYLVYRWQQEHLSNSVWTLLAWFKHGRSARCRVIPSRAARPIANWRDKYGRWVRGRCLVPSSTTRTRNGVVFAILNWTPYFGKRTDGSAYLRINEFIPQWIAWVNCLETNWPWWTAGRRNTQVECSCQSWQVMSETFDIRILSRSAWSRTPGLILLTDCSNIM